ncbi:MAG: hypothetical protein IKO47_06230 [Ruminococcus sp.]|nr:hypothetical protein [Ruminococcus sp.]
MKGNFITKIPAGSPVGEILKIIGMIVATVLVEKMSELFREVSEKSPFVDAKFKEGR